jgi:hypothetical protein
MFIDTGRGREAELITLSDFNLARSLVRKHQHRKSEYIIFNSNF